MTYAEKFDYILRYIKRIAGEEYVAFNNSVYLSEKENADRNFCIGFRMKENNCFPELLGDSDTLQKTVDMYFQACSLGVNTETLAVMAGTLANGGVCPTTGEKVQTHQHISQKRS